MSESIFSFYRVFQLPQIPRKTQRTLPLFPMPSYLQSLRKMRTPTLIFKTRSDLKLMSQTPAPDDVALWLAALRWDQTLIHACCIVRSNSEYSSSSQQILRSNILPANNTLFLVKTAFRKPSCSVFVLLWVWSTPREGLNQKGVITKGFLVSACVVVESAIIPAKIKRWIDKCPKLLCEDEIATVWYLFCCLLCLSCPVLCCVVLSRLCHFESKV